MSLEKLPKRHPREKIVHEAHIKLSAVLIEIEKELTWGEYLRMITNKLCSEWQSVTKSVIREERHSDDPDKPGG